MSNNLVPDILYDEASSEDNFSQKTHENLAKTLFNLIFALNTKNESKDGLTIGLEGEWGSGKSTIIRIFKKLIDDDNFYRDASLKNKPNPFYFYFDSWAHEGDPLRRIFLEKLIEAIPSQNINKEERENLKDQILKKSKSTKVTKNISLWGNILTSSFILTSIGLESIISNPDTFSYSKMPILFVIKLLMLLFAPISLITYGIKRYKAKNSNTSKKENLSFFDDEYETLSEIDEDERSSVEFEKIFNAAITLIENAGFTQIVLVIDNLDRINSDDSLKLWSTLQIFFQSRNPNRNSNKNTRSLHNRIWTIIPYDEIALRRLWNKKLKDPIEYQETKDNISDTDINYNRDSYSFLEKCFQIRLEVPRMIIRNWNIYCKDQLNKIDSVFKESEKEKKIAIDVLSATIDLRTNVLSPRILKIFVNHVGVIYSMYYEHNFSMQAITYYVVLKFILAKTKDEIEQIIISDDIPPNIKTITKDTDSREFIRDLCGILYGVSGDIGMEILLRKNIVEALEFNDTDEINKLVEIEDKDKNKDKSFFTAFNNLLNEEKFSSIQLYRFAITLYNSEVHKTDRDIVIRLMNYINSRKDLPEVSKIDESSENKFNVSNIDDKDYWSALTSLFKFLNGKKIESLSMMEVFISLLINTFPNAKKDDLDYWIRQIDESLKSSGLSRYAITKNKFTVIVKMSNIKTWVEIARLWSNHPEYDKYKILIPPIEIIDKARQSLQNNQGIKKSQNEIKILYKYCEERNIFEIKKHLHDIMVEIDNPTSNTPVGEDSDDDIPF